MNCADFRNKVHEFLDLRLSAREMSAMNLHMSQCAACETLHQQLNVIKDSLCQKHVLPQAAAQSMLRQIKQRRETTWIERFNSILAGLLSTWRDWDRRFLWSKATAVPLTLCFFISIMFHFTPSRVEKLAALLVSSQNQGQTELRLMRSVEVRQDRSDFNELMDTAWRLPYEDSLFLVAEITPEGKAEIGDVIDYPKSVALLDAVDTALKTSQFEANDLKNPFLIYSFQKIDVYDDNRGL